jgi:hypothetical protein
MRRGARSMPRGLKARATVTAPAIDDDQTTDD